MEQVNTGFARAVVEAAYRHASTPNGVDFAEVVRVLSTALLVASENALRFDPEVPDGLLVNLEVVGEKVYLKVFAETLECRATRIVALPAKKEPKKSRWFRRG